MIPKSLATNFRFSPIRLGGYLLTIGLVVFSWLKFLVALAFALILIGMAHRYFQNKYATFFIGIAAALFALCCFVTLDLYGVQRQCYTSSNGTKYEFLYGKWKGEPRKSLIEFPDNHSSGILWMASEFPCHQLFSLNNAYRVDTTMYKENMPSGIHWISTEFSENGKLHGRRVRQYFYPHGRTNVDFFIEGKRVAKSDWEREALGK